MSIKVVEMKIRGHIEHALERGFYPIQRAYSTRDFGLCLLGMLAEGLRLWGAHPAYPLPDKIQIGRALAIPLDRLISMEFGWERAPGFSLMASSPEWAALGRRLAEDYLPVSP